LHILPGFETINFSTDYQRENSSMMGYTIGIGQIDLMGGMRWLNMSAGLPSMIIGGYQL
jgi:hypothetical protein